MPVIPLKITKYKKIFLLVFGYFYNNNYLCTMIIKSHTQDDKAK